MPLTAEETKDVQSLLNRSITPVEESIFEAMWSEHCSYKSSKSVLRGLPTKGSEVALGIGEDSGIIRFAEHNGEQYCIAVSHESHNHPSQILPIEGAATGVGGVVRDVYCMGADVVGVLNSLHFGVPSDNDPSLVDEIADKVVQGISDYGNPLGVPMLGGETIYHSSFNDNCLVNVAALGLLKESDIIHSYVPDAAKSEPYDVILVGKSTDMTGFGGARFSSNTLDTDAQDDNVGAVQVHDPFLKRVLVEAIHAVIARVKEKSVDIGFKDLGAGGIACATSEIAAANGFGVKVQLDKVNVVSESLEPRVIACSETQERFCFAVPRWFSQEVVDIFNKDFALPDIYPNAGASVIGEVVTDPVYRVFYHDEVVAELPINIITTDVSVVRTAEPTSHQPTLTDISPSQPIQDVCLGMVQSLNNASKRYVYRFFDQAVKGNAVVYPGEADAGVIAPIPGSNAGLAVSMDSNLIGEYDAYQGAAHAVAESVRNVISVGARPIALTDCLNFGNPEKGPVFYDFQQAVQGISDAANGLSFIENEPIPIISGNVSFYNESKQGNAVVPSPVICCMGRMDDHQNVVYPYLKEAGLHLYLIGDRKPEFAGTQLSQWVDGTDKTPVPSVSISNEKIANHVVLSLLQSQKVSNCHDISSGGLWIALIEMCLGERGLSHVGLELDFGENNLWTTLFSENGGYVIGVPEQSVTDVEQALTESKCSFAHIGRTVEADHLSIQSSQETMSFSLDSLSTLFNTRNQ